MESQIQIRPRNINLFFVIIFWIYTIIHFIIVLYYIITDVDFSDINEVKVNYILLFSAPFISFLITAIFTTMNYCSNACKLYICLIPSLITEIIFIIFLILLIIIINSYHYDSKSMLIIIFLFSLESIPNILLFIYICIKTKNKNYKNLDNINNNSPLLNTN